MIPTKVYDTYWEFAAERQRIFFSRLRGEPFPWSNDAVLQTYKFTNAYRACDRTSQYLIRNILYCGKNFPPEDVLFRILIFKIFNKIETWEVLEKEFGEILYKNFKKKDYASLLAKTQLKQSIFSSAYIMPSGVGRKKHEYYLSLVDFMLQDGLSAKIARSKSLEELYHLLLNYKGLGSFLAFQFAIDINYSDLCDFSEMSFVVPGPGAKRGIQKCFSDRHLNYTQIIKYVSDRQEEEFAKRGLNFETLFGRRLQLVDCQNLFCEVDKYSRIVYPKIKTKDNRVKIKRKFVPSEVSIDYFFPPKWNINHKMARKQTL